MALLCLKILTQSKPLRQYLNLEKTSSHFVSMHQIKAFKLPDYFYSVGNELVSIYQAFFSASVWKEHGCSHSIFSPLTYFDSFQGVALIKLNVLLNLWVVFMATSHDHSLQFPGSDVEYLSAEVAVSLLIAYYWFKQQTCLDKTRYIYMCHKSIVTE